MHGLPLLRAQLPQKIFCFPGILEGKHCGIISMRVTLSLLHGFCFFFFFLSQWFCFLSVFTAENQLKFLIFKEKDVLQQPVFLQWSVCVCFLGGWKYELSWRIIQSCVRETADWEFSVFPGKMQSCSSLQVCAGNSLGGAAAALKPCLYQSPAFLLEFPTWDFNPCMVWEALKRGGGTAWSQERRNPRISTVHLQGNPSQRLQNTRNEAAAPTFPWGWEQRDQMWPWVFLFLFCFFFPRTKALVLELLAAVCLVRGGHEIILSAFDNFKEVGGAAAAKFGCLCFLSGLIGASSSTSIPSRKGFP